MIDIGTIADVARHFGVVYFVAQTVFAAGYATTMVAVSQLGLVEGESPAEPILSQLGSGLIVGLLFGVLGAIAFASIATVYRYSGGIL